MVSLQLIITVLLFFIASLMIGLPVPLCIMFAAALFFPFLGRPFSLVIVAQKIVATFDMNPLFAIFFFVALGNILLKSKLSDIIIDFVDSIFGRVKGGLAVITIVSEAFFGALTGAVVSAIAAIGGITIPAMKKRGYDGPFATAVATAAGINGSMIPPSINGLTYAIVNNLSVAYVFIATLVPGILYAICLSIAAVIISRKRHYKASEEHFSFNRTTKTFFRALPALIVPISLIVLIYGGIATPTESGALAVFVALLLGFVGYRTLNLESFKEAMVDTCISTGTIMFLIASSFILSYSFSMSGITFVITNFFWSVSESPQFLFLIVILILLALGTILDAQAIIIIFSPVVAEIFAPLEVDPLHLAGVYIFACLIGLIIPPVASGLVVGCAVGNEKLLVVTKELLPFLGVAVFSLVLITYIPEIILFLPRLLGYGG